MVAKADFHVHGIVISTKNGDVILNAGDNMTILPQGNFITFAAQIPPNAVINNSGTWLPPSMSDAVAPKGSLFYSTTSSKLSYCDPAGLIHVLY